MIFEKKQFLLSIVLLSLGLSLYAGEDKQEECKENQEECKDNKGKSRISDDALQLSLEATCIEAKESEYFKEHPENFNAFTNELWRGLGKRKGEKAFLEQNSLLYSHAHPSVQSSTFFKKFVMPFEGAIMLALIYKVPNLFTSIFCDGLLEKGAQRLCKKINNRVFASHLISTSNIANDLNIDDLVLDPSVYRQLVAGIGSFSNIAKNKGRAQFNGLLFYGEPGTGKTEAARVMASMISRNNDIYYHELCGEVLAGASREELRDFIDSLKTYRKPTIILIDECEKFLLDRRLGLRKGEKIPEGLSEWLNFTSKPSKYIQFIYTTNYKDKIDKAMMRRVHPIKFALPKVNDRAQLLYTFFDKYFLKDLIYTDDERCLMQETFTFDYFKEIAKQLVYTRKDSNGKVIEEDKFSPANIENIVNDVKNFSIAVDEHGVPMKEFFENIVARALQVKTEEVDTERRLFGLTFEDVAASAA
ncbi:AAA family ATPase [Candidatus Babeliales bacterium]|nr:AAA family ATPase [Candidatus Babeliales bacterium]